jgi:cell filamentation protein
VNWDPYLDLESGVLRNRLGITDRAELTRVEAVLTASRIYDLQRRPSPGRYDLAHMQVVHKFVFGDLYDWAGEIRTVSIGKGALFCLPQYIVSTSAEIFGRIARSHHLRGLDRAAFVEGLTELFADVNALHRSGKATAER